MSGGNPERRIGRPPADEGKPVLGGRPKTRPRALDRQSRQAREEVRGTVEHLVEEQRIEFLVEAHELA